MSEFQYLEFLSIDKALTDSEIAEVSSWSSRSNVSSRRAIFTYSYSDFRKDEEKVLLKFFDAFFYIANWGTRRLMFKLPKKLVNYELMKQYKNDTLESIENSLKIYKKGNNVIVDIQFNEEGGFGWLEEEQEWLLKMKELRSDLLNGDCRSLFLIWLHIIHIKHVCEILDPSFKINTKLIPPNLNNLHAGLLSLIDFFEIDVDWVNASSKYSSQVIEDAQGNVNLISKLPRSKKEDYLLRLLKDEVNLSIKLKKELSKLEDKKEAIKEENVEISVEEFMKSADEAIKTRKKKAKAKARRAYLKKMKDLAKNESDVKERIEENIIRGSGSSYDEALQDILDLKELSTYNNEKEAFGKFVKKLVEKYPNKPAMMRRLKENGWK